MKNKTTLKVVLAVVLVIFIIAIAFLLTCVKEAGKIKSYDATPADKELQTITIDFGKTIEANKEEKIEFYNTLNADELKIYGNGVEVLQTGEHINESGVVRKDEYAQFSYGDDWSKIKINTIDEFGTHTSTYEYTYTENNTTIRYMQRKNIIDAKVKEVSYHLPTENGINPKVEKMIKDIFTDAKIDFEVAKTIEYIETYESGVDKIKLTKQDGDETTLYINPNTMSLYAYTSTGESFVVGAEDFSITARFYQEDKEAFQLPEDSITNKFVILFIELYFDSITA